MTSHLAVALGWTTLDLASLQAAMQLRPPDELRHGPATALATGYARVPRAVLTMHVCPRAAAQQQREAMSAEAAAG